MMRTSMSSLFVALAALLVAAPWAVGQSSDGLSAEEKGQAIMEKINALPRWERVATSTVLKIYDKQDKLLFTKRTRGARYFRDYNDPGKRLQNSITYFYAPADDKGNGSLNIEHEDSDDDEQYLYLKQTRKVRRIIGSSKKDDFFGSDFALGDVVRRRIQDYHFKWLSEETVDFKGKKLKVQKVESVFKDPTKRDDWGEGKSVIYIHQASGLVFKAERYNLQMQLHKVMTLKGFSKHKNRDGKSVYGVAQIEMKTIARGTRSVFTIKEAKYENDAGFDAAIFSTDSLTRKWW
ncbi:MAG: outer membrane lipoprotein-sorting protein [SAR324 cluster bacterium]|nr:outer membrane lipoprotein-sorting protein [SAR324 cluster bacterium]